MEKDSFSNGSVKLLTKIRHMKTNNDHLLLQKAIYELDQMKKELNRPKEDVVAYTLCHMIRKSALDFLNYYLLINNVDISHSNNLAEAHKHCIVLDDEFKNLDFSGLNCAGEKVNEQGSHCLEVNRLIECVDSVESAKKMVVDRSGDIVKLAVV